MFQASRKRSRPSAFASLKKTNDETVGFGPLKGVVVSLTGFDPDDKDQSHALVQELGGRFTRDLNPSENTHLIAREASGAKYEVAVSANLYIVGAGWLEDCQKQQRRVEESAHIVAPSTTKERPCVELSRTSLLEQVDHCLNSIERPQSDLFSIGNLHLVGFEDGSDLQVRMSRLLRRGLGTIYWDFFEDITHVIVIDGADPAIERAAALVKEQYPNGPEFVSPWWVLDSWANNELLKTSRYPPVYAEKQVAVEKSMNAERNVKATTLFKGSIFCLLRVSPPSWAVDFDSPHLERAIRAHGGQLLSPKMVEALKIDAAGGAAPKRRCYVIGWGGYTPSHMEIHPLLSQVKRHGLCHMEQVTPIWLHTCLTEERVVTPSRVPEIFCPDSRPIHKLVDKKLDDTPTVRVSVTGLSGSQRTAVMHLVEAMGARYDDALKSSTTHLICRAPEGAKYWKAVEWNLHRITIEWLYHVAAYGLAGENGTAGQGCEDRFPIVEETPETEESA